MKRLLKYSIYLTLLALTLVLSSNWFIETAYDDKVFTNSNNIAKKRIGLVLGTIPKTKSGNDNLFYKYRIQAAVKLWKEDKISHFVVSGDNHIKEYDEPSEMKKDLIKSGIPSYKITCDYAGFRTLDSIERLSKVFGQNNNIVVISQEFHNKRALFLCHCFDIEAIAFNARNPPLNYSIASRLREVLARTKAFLDIFLLFTEPRFLGDKVGLTDN